MSHSNKHKQVKLTQREQVLPVESNEKFHVLAVTRDGRTHHVNSVHAADSQTAMDLTAQKYDRKHSGEPKERVYSFHEAIEFKVVKDSDSTRFKKERSDTSDSFQQVGSERSD